MKSKPTVRFTETDAAAAPSFTARAEDTVSDLLDYVVEFQRMRSLIDACEADVVDAARRLKLLPLEAEPARTSGWSAENIAMRELSSELGVRLRVHENTARNLIERSRSLVHDLPATLDSMRSGDITLRHARAIIDETGSLRPDANADQDAVDAADAAMRGLEAAALEIAAGTSVGAFERRIRALRERVHPDSMTQRNREAREKRCVDVQPGRDGMSWLTALLPSEQANAIDNRLRLIVRATASASARAASAGGAGAGGDAGGTDASGAGGADDVVAAARTIAQRRADAFVTLLLDGEVDPYDSGVIAPDIAANRPAPDPAGRAPGLRTRSPRARVPAGIRASVHVNVPVLTLLGHDVPATLDGVIPIDAQTARELAKHAPSFVRLLTHPETGATLSVGRESYTVPADMRRWLVERDLTCRFPGCDEPATHADADHTIPYNENGEQGETCVANLAMLCARHHRFKHQTRWRVQQLGAGVLIWTSPEGRSYPTRPANTLASAPPF
ncbi:DUF222 domain-containing protein [Galbitalea sp. SE-J8]|uniref:HNH endonuclease signature motif containing protein n=1 Tax=Galbitalea sp. SE-J8 TaxID=3054952 RepID=UPI00259CF869|nr:HNH endonuclease signature motif containing protein [Galbitalea sp. SE-J8]MDM4761529.1 DUF222 domain-containing protein [Galbitalea sp. SE-J8]